jgi:isoleucyl-tRNA synthetase
MNEMELVRDYVNQGLSIRAKAGIKVRQPLKLVSVPELGTAFDFAPILRDELNVKEVKQSKELAIDLQVTPELKREGLMRELVRQVQIARKDAGLQVDDRITLQIHSTAPEVSEAVEVYEKLLKDETLASSLSQARLEGYSTSVRVEDYLVNISLAKV